LTDILNRIHWPSGHPNLKNISDLKILITGGNHARALKLLKAFPSHFILFGDYDDVPGMSTSNYAFASLGKLNTDSIAHILLNFCITESIDSIIPLNDFELEPLAKSAVLFEEYGIDVLLPRQEIIDKYMASGKQNYPEFAVYVKGSCVYSSSDQVELPADSELNGVFGFGPSVQEFKLFTVS